MDEETTEKLTEMSNQQFHRDQQELAALRAELATFKEQTARVAQENWQAVLEAREEREAAHAELAKALRIAAETDERASAVDANNATLRHNLKLLRIEHRLACNQRNEAQAKLAEVTRERDEYRLKCRVPFTQVIFCLDEEQWRRWSTVASLRGICHENIGPVGNGRLSECVFSHPLENRLADLLLEIGAKDAQAELAAERAKRLEAEEALAEQRALKPTPEEWAKFNKENLELSALAEKLRGALEGLRYASVRELSEVHSDVWKAADAAVAATPSAALEEFARPFIEILERAQYMNAWTVEQMAEWTAQAQSLVDETRRKIGGQP